MVGRTIAQYLILDRLGGGGMGEIYRAKDTRLNRTVAIKVLPKTDSANEQRRQRFLQEAQTASGLNHPNIVTVHDIIVDGEADLLVMELVTGQTLSDLIPAGGMPAVEVLAIGVQIASALATAHAAGIVHRDLKPANIMVTSSGLVKVLDFGLAKATLTGSPHESGETRSIASPLTVAGTVLGTVNYMSPEQAEGKMIDGRSDVFSLGILFYEMVTGQAAFKSDSMIATMSAILRDEVRPILQLAPETPQELVDIIDRCLRKNPENRWQSMEELRSALQMLKQRYDSGSVPAIRLPVPVVPLPRRKSRVPVFVMVGVGAAATMGAGGWWLSTRQTASPAPPPVVAQQPAQPAPPPAPAPAPDPVLTNDSIIEMVTQAVPVPVILDQIRSSKTKFEFSVPEVIRLSKAGVTAGVIQAMRDPSKIPAATGALPKSPAGSLVGSKASPSKQLPAAPAAKDAAAQPAVVVPIPASHEPAVVAAPPPVPVVPAPATATVTIPDGLPFAIELAEDVPNDVSAGTPIRFRVSKAVVTEGMLVIPQGASVTGQIVDESRRKALVMSIKATYELTRADGAGGQRVKVRGTPSPGQSRRPIDSGGRKKPKDIAAVAGTPYVAYIDGAQKISVRK